jgi:hypothetical protein
MKLLLVVFGLFGLFGLFGRALTTRPAIVGLRLRLVWVVAGVRGGCAPF